MNQQFAFLTNKILTFIIENENGISERKLINSSFEDLNSSPSSFIQFLLMNGDITLFLNDGEVYYKAANHYMKHSNVGALS